MQGGVFTAALHDQTAGHLDPDPGVGNPISPLQVGRAVLFTSECINDPIKDRCFPLGVFAADNGQPVFSGSNADQGNTFDILELK